MSANEPPGIFQVDDVVTGQIYGNWIYRKDAQQWIDDHGHDRMRIRNLA